MRRSDCYRVERSSSRAGLSPAVVQCLSGRTVMLNVIRSVSRGSGLMEMSARLARIRCHRGTVSRDRLPIINPLTANAIGPLDQFRAGDFPCSTMRMISISPSRALRVLRACSAAFCAADISVSRSRGRTSTAESDNLGQHSLSTMKTRIRNRFHHVYSCYVPVVRDKLRRMQYREQITLSRPLSKERAAPPLAHAHEE